MIFFHPKTTIAILLCLIFSSSSYALTEQQDTAPQTLRGNWFYYWGDLPRDQASNQWQYQQVEWSIIDFPENMPNRQGENIVWVKTDLPSGNWRDPYLFINAVDLTFEAFHNQQKIYHFGKIDTQGNSRFEGWPWHAFHLPDNYEQHTLYFRIASDYPSIGLSGKATIGNRFDLLNQVYKAGLTGLSLILFVLLVGIISTVMGTIKKDKAVAISTGLLSFNIALMMFSENELSQTVLFEPLFWRYIAAFCYFLIPAFLSVIILAWLKEKPPVIARIVLTITLVFSLGVAGLSMFTSFNFVNAYPYFDVLFIILVLALLTGCTKRFYQHGITGSLMTFGIFALFISLLLDMLSAHGFITWIGHTGQWGLALFTLSSLIIYLVQDWQQQIALNTLTHQLESKVLIRTAELQSSQNKLEKLAQEDYLTSLLNRRAFTERAINEVALAIRHQRPVSLLLFDLDHFKDVNDKYGHAAGDLVLKAVANICKETCRHGELICRYGGEEFVILLHATDIKFAHSLATRLCNALKNISIEVNNNEINITASFGLINLKHSKAYTGKPEHVVEHLLAEADKMMYEVKVSGRDGVKTHEIILSKPV